MIKSPSLWKGIFCGLLQYLYKKLEKNGYTVYNYHCFQSKAFNGGVGSLKELFGTLADGQPVHLYTLQRDGIKAQIMNLGATLVRLFVPAPNGKVDDVVLGYDDPNAYLESDGFLGTVVGRNANRIKNGAFVLDNKTYTIDQNDNRNNLHSGNAYFYKRVWEVVSSDDTSIVFQLESPDGDQGFPGKATIRVTYALNPGRELSITYDAISDKDTVFNFTNHSYFNLAGHTNTHMAMGQELILPARVFAIADAESIPTGEMRAVDGSPMDFRAAKPIGRDIDQDYDALNLQGGYDHNFEVFANPCAILTDPASGRTMAVYTDCPGVQFYSGNYLNNPGKEGVFYCKRSGICLETQFYPDSVNKPQWRQPFVEAGTPYHSQTRYIFK